jgi:acyl-CoA thioesterase-1
MRHFVKTFLRAALVLTMLLLGSPVSFAEDSRPKILVMGDSLMAVNRTLGGSVAEAMEKQLGQKVEDHSLLGARYFYKVPLLAQAGMQISAQYRPGPWDFVVMNGGGNDLLFGCGCGACTRVMDRLISADGSKGAIPQLVTKVRAGGAEVIYTGYMRTPGVNSPVESCGPLGDELDRRLAAMAELDGGVTFLLLADLVKKDGDKSYHGLDLVHPSVKGSRAIAARVADLMGR